MVASVTIQTNNHPAPNRSDYPKVWAVLDSVPDPEIPVISVTELGIVRDVVDNGVIITPTYTGCPATAVIERSIREALDEAGYHAMEIRTEIDPAWTTDWISEQGREKLLAYGIAPPPRGDGRGTLTESQATPCPQCRSTNTEEISRFGSTPCKALMRCLDCLEPFDRFKCI